MYEPKTDILPITTPDVDPVHVTYIDENGNKIESDVVPRDIYEGSLDVDTGILNINKRW